MLKKYLVLLLVVIVFNSAGGSFILAQTKDDKKAKKTAKIKSKILKLGTGEKANVRVETIFGSKVKGYVSSSDENSFTVTDTKSGAETSIKYGEVYKLRGKGLSGGAKTAIIAAAIAVPVTIVLLFFGKYYCNEQAC